MNILMKSTTIGALLLTTLSSSALAAISSVNPTEDLVKTPVNSVKQQEFSTVRDFYQGDFQQLSRALVRSMDPAMLYTGTNANLTPSARIIFA